MNYLTVSLLLLFVGYNCIAFRSIGSSWFRNTKVRSRGSKLGYSLQGYINEMKKKESPMLALINNTAVNKIMIDAKDISLTNNNLVTTLTKSETDAELQKHSARLGMFSSLINDNSTDIEEFRLNGAPNGKALQREVQQLLADGKFPMDEYRLSKEDRENLPKDRQEFDLLLNRMINAPSDVLHESILDAHRAILMSHNLIQILREKNNTVIDGSTRTIYRKIVDKSFDLMDELVKLMQTVRLKHLDVITSLCNACVDYKDDTLKFLDAIDPIRKGFDEEFLQFLNHETSLTRLKLSKADPLTEEYSVYEQWITVLGTIQTAVENEFFRRHYEVLSHLMFVIMFDHDKTRRDVFSQLLNETHATDLQAMRKLGKNMYEGVLGLHPSVQATLPNADKIVDQMENLKEDIKLLMTDEYIRGRLDVYRQEVAEQGWSLEYGKFVSDESYNQFVIDESKAIPQAPGALEDSDNLYDAMSFPDETND